MNPEPGSPALPEGRAASRRPRLIPPLYLACAILVMYALDRLAPLARWHGTLSRVLGVLVAALGVGVAVWSTRLFRSAGTTIRVFEESSALVTSGPYRFSRNPIYLSMMALLFGLNLWLESLSPFFVILLFAVLIQQKFILAEESGLERHFGAVYTEYKGRVRRWI
jgi:protein-S-isoprenylcysteine O-methyltransferase Ste14